MNILVTAGNTLAPIDRVRGVTNIFTGRTGAAIALCAHSRGHNVTLLTSHPEAVSLMREEPMPADTRWAQRRYTTFDDLHHLMAAMISAEDLDAVIHCAAVSDYLPAGVYGLSQGTHFVPQLCIWDGTPPTLTDRSNDDGKVRSDEPELWLRMVRAPKLVDCIRTDWLFHGVLVKFKLEVGVDDAALLGVAEASRVQSDADLMVANTLEGSQEWAYYGPFDGAYQKVSRSHLARLLLEAVERLHAEGERE